MQSRKDVVRVKLADDRKDLGALDVPVQIQGAPRPRFSYALFIDDTKNGNGDGLLQPGEGVDLVVSIKNSGEGASEEPMALLKNLGGAEVFIETSSRSMLSYLLKPLTDQFNRALREE